MTAEASHTSRRVFLFAAIAVVLAGCQPSVDYRGYQARSGDLAKVQVGMPKTEIEALLGSPSTTASIALQGDSYYYISSRVEQTAFLNPVETERQVFAVRFDSNDQVVSFANYGMEDGQIIDFNTRKTPTKGKELTIVQQLLGNVGRFKSTGSASGSQGASIPR
ncbi:MAG TPA: outer membrane protein assembly factor BamE [Aestuariivirgaceae bacterium]|jgi:outer membrane protein assembly factor BamE (lipoprotein component of BamABCDE complex)|nr:outer membrane protein assembly factor BamE [Aestuariivirgaceae bacterium]